MQAHAADLVEIFSSIQGEGPQVGVSTLFVRFSRCDLRCNWCDTPHSWRRTPRVRIERRAGSADFEECDNPLPLSELEAHCRRLLAERQHRFLSLTGGEPLLQPGAVRALAEALRGPGLDVLLETHGLAESDALRRVLPAIDVLSMDWKFASDVRRAKTEAGDAGENFSAAHERFLRTALSAPQPLQIVVKCVITPGTRDDEWEEVVQSLSRTCAHACLVLQPVTPFAAAKQRPDIQRLLELERRAREHLEDVRILPQVHPLLGVS